MNARHKALKTLRRVHHGAFSSAALSATLESGVSDIDRSFITDLIYGTLRFEITLDALLAPHLTKPEKLPHDIRDILRLGAYDILYRDTPRHAAVNEWVEVAKKTEPRLSGLVNAVLRKVEKRDLPPAQRYGVPDWLYNEWVSLFGEESAEASARGMSEPEPLWLVSYNPRALETLREEGHEATRGTLERTLITRLRAPLPQTRAYREGMVQPQNPASTLPVRMLDPDPGERVLDLASGNGIKAALLASLGAKPVSIELNQKKLERADRNLERLGLETVSMQYDLTTVPPIPPASKVLLDAPCTGTGTLRGNPEIRTKVRPEDVTELSALQRQMLETAAVLTAPGGLLVYAVCALTHAEGVGMAEGFLSDHPEFSSEPFLVDVDSSNTPYGSYILPVNGFDGFFISRLRRYE